MDDVRSAKSEKKSDVSNRGSLVVGKESAKLLTIKHFLRLNTHYYLHTTT